MTAKTDKKEIKNVHNFLWISHGVLTLLLGLIFLLLESFIRQALDHVDADPALEEIRPMIDLVLVFCSWKQGLCWYGLITTLLFTLYHFYEQLNKIVLYLFILAHIPLSIYLSYVLVTIVDSDNESYYSILLTVIGSEFTMLACLVLSLIYVYKSGNVDVVAEEEQVNPA